MEGKPKIRTKENQGKNSPFGCPPHQSNSLEEGVPIYRCW